MLAIFGDGGGCVGEVCLTSRLGERCYTDELCYKVSVFHDEYRDENWTRGDDGVGLGAIGKSYGELAVGCIGDVFSVWMK